MRRFSQEKKWQPFDGFTMLLILVIWHSRGKHLILTRRGRIERRTLQIQQGDKLSATACKLSTWAFVLSCFVLWPGLIQPRLASNLLCGEAGLELIFLPLGPKCCDCTWETSRWVRGLNSPPTSRALYNWHFCSHREASLTVQHFMATKTLLSSQVLRSRFYFMILLHRACIDVARASLLLLPRKTAASLWGKNYEVW